MAVGLRGGTTNPNEDRTFYVREMIQRAKVNLVWGNYGKKEFIPTNGGLTAQWRLHKRISPSTTALVEGTYNAEVAITVIAVNASVAQYGQFYRQTEVIAAQAIDDIRAEGAGALGQAMGESYEQLVRNIAVGGTTAQFAGAGTSRGNLTSGMRLTAAELREARTTLVKNAAPGPYVVIIEPDQEYDLWGDSNFSNAVKDAGVRGDGNPLFTGKLPNYLGMDIQVSNILLTVAGGKSLGLSGADVYYAVAFSKDNFFGNIDLSALPKQEIYHEPGSGGATTDPLNQTWSQGYKFAYAGAILDQTFGVRVETTSSLGSLG